MDILKYGSLITGVISNSPRISSQALISAIISHNADDDTWLKANATCANLYFTTHGVAKGLYYAGKIADAVATNQNVFPVVRRIIQIGQNYAPISLNTLDRLGDYLGSLGGSTTAALLVIGTGIVMYKTFTHLNAAQGAS